MTETLAVRTRVRDGVPMTSVEQPRATYRQVFAVREFRALLAGFAVFLVSETVQMLALSVLIYAAPGRRCSPPSPTWPAFCRRRSAGRCCWPSRTGGGRAGSCSVSTRSG